MKGEGVLSEVRGSIPPRRVCITYRRLTSLRIGVDPVRSARYMHA